MIKFIDNWIFLALIFFVPFSKTQYTIDSTLVSYYPFSGNVSDMSGNGHDCTIYGATLTTDRFGNPNSAYQFQKPSSNQITCPIPIDTFKQDFTITVWALLVSGCYYCGIVSNNQNVFEGAILTTVDNYQNVGFTHVNQNADGVNVYLGSDLQNKWNFQVLKKEGPLYTVYANTSNGMTLSSSGIIPWDIKQGNLIVIGNHQQDRAQYWNGKIDDIRIYSRPLTEQEIQFLQNGNYTGLSNILGLGLVSFYPFSNISDMSGNGYDCSNIEATPTTDRLGIPRNSLYFNGNNASLMCPISSSIFYYQNDWTFVGWIYHLSNHDWAQIFNNNIGISQGPIFIFQYGADANLLGMHRDGVNSTGTKVDLGSDHLNKWIFVAIKKEQQKIKVYAVFPGVTATILGNLGDIQWTLNNGSLIYLGVNFNGTIDDAMFFNRSLTPDELYQIYCFPWFFYKENQSCVQKCPDGYFANYSICSRCNTQCKTCINGNNCTSFNLLTNGLAAYYPFNANWKDYSGNGNDCTSINQVTFGVDRFGFPLRAPKFDGSVTYLKCPIDPATYQNNFTFTAWLYWKSLMSWSGIISNLENDSFSNAPIFGKQGNSNQIGMHQAFNPLGGTWLDLGNNFLNKWMFAVLIVERPVIKVNVQIKDENYLEIEGNLGWAFQQASNNFIARNGQNAMEIFNGSIDDVRIYNRALRKNEILALYCIPNQFYFIINSSCLNSCPEGYYINESNCSKCNNSCKTCNLIDFNCTSCPANTILQKAKCITTCPEGFLLINSECVSRISQIDQGLVSFQPFQLDSVDQSGNRNDCENQGATLTDDRQGNANSAQEFGGNLTSYLRCPIPQSTFANNWTLLGWIQQKGKTSMDEIFNNNININEGPTFSLWGDNHPNAIGMHQWGVTCQNGAWLELGTNHTFKWLFVVLKIELGKMKVYSFSPGENSLYTEANLYWTLKTTPIINIGRMFVGKIDSARFYNISLSDNDILSILCLPNLYYFQGNYSCLSSCPDGYQIDGANCSKCNNSCLTCDQTKDKCTSCNYGSGLLNYKCFTNCPNGFIINNSLCVSPIPGLVSQYPFQSNVNDWSGNKNHCNRQGVTLDSDRNNDTDNGYYFNGVDNQMKCPIERLTFQNDWTFSAWIKHKGPTIYASIFSNNIQNVEAAELAFNQNEDRLGMFRQTVNASGPFVNLGADHYNKWIFVVLQREQDNLIMRAWIQNENYLSAKESLYWNLSNADWVQLGRMYSESSNFFPFNGTIDDVRIYNRSLTYEELLSLQCYPNSFYQQINYSCIQSCPDGWFINGSQCSQCNSSCKTCIFTENNCTSCEQNLLFLSGKCLINCPDGFFNNNSICVSLIQGLVSFQPFYRDGTDWSGNYNDCTNQGATLTIDRFLAPSTAQKFESLSSYFQCPIQNSTFKDNWTVSVWVNRASTSSWGGIISNNVGIKQAAVLSFYRNENKIGMHNIDYDTESGPQLSLDAEHFNEWIFVVMRRKQTSLRIDGFLLGKNSWSIEGNLSWNLLYTNSIFIGISTQPSDQLFNGSLDDIRIYNRSITDNEIYSLLCIPNQIYFKNNSSCLSTCPDGWFRKQFECLKCNNSCQTCDAYEDNCTSCNALYGFYNQQCLIICPNGMFNNNSICRDCNSSCLTCNIGENSCTSCSESFGYLNNQCLLQCPSGYYKNGSLCSNCNISCLTCINITNNCSSCLFPFGLFNSSCYVRCPDKYFVNESAICYPCNSSCNTCSITENNCTSCPQEQGYLNRECLLNCPIGYYKNGSFCNNCNSSCLTCTGSSNVCTSCLLPLGLLNSSCLFACPDKQFINESAICQPCNSSCNTCNITENNCTSCLANYGQLKGQCYLNCPNGYFLNKTFCSQCNASCGTCNNSENFCTSCLTNQSYLDGKCFDACPEEYWNNSSNCTLCNLTACKTCKDSENFCTSCQAKLIFVENIGQCFPFCQSREFFNKQITKCENCGIFCTDCKSSQICNKCDSGYAINWIDSSNNVCEKQQCLTNEYRVNGACNPCPTNCKTCISDNFCLSCYTNYGLNQNQVNSSTCKECLKTENWVNNYCVPKCLEGQYLNKATNICANCIFPCKDCLNDTSCISCQNKLFLTGLKNCLETCPDGNVIDNINGTLFCTQCQINNCLKCASVIECKQCKPSTFLYNGICIQQCPSAMPPNSQNVCTTAGSITTSEEAESIKNDFTKSLLSILSMDDSINTISGDNIDLSEQASTSIINSFLGMTEGSTSETVDNVFSNSMINEIIKSAVNTSFSNLSNASVQDIFDNKENIIMLCAATKMSQLSNYTDKCKDIVETIKNDKMTMNQTKGMLELLLITALPRQIKLPSNNSTTNSSSKLESIYSSTDKAELLGSLISISNSLCLRNSPNYTNISYSDVNADIVFQNITSSTTIVGHINSSEKVVLNIAQENALWKSIELDQALEIVPKSKEIFISKVVQVNILKFCSPSLSNENQPQFTIKPNELQFDVNFTVANEILSSFPIESGYKCGYLDLMNVKQVNENLSSWEYFGDASKFNAGWKTILGCPQQNKLGFYAILYDKESTKSNSLVLIVCLCVGAIFLIGIAIFLLWFWKKYKATNQQVSPNNAEPVKAEKKKPKTPKIKSFKTIKPEKTTIKIEQEEVKPVKKNFKAQILALKTMGLGLFGGSTSQEAKKEEIPTESSKIIQVQQQKDKSETIKEIKPIKDEKKPKKRSKHHKKHA